MGTTTRRGIAGLAVAGLAVGAGLLVAAPAPGVPTWTPADPVSAPGADAAGPQVISTSEGRVVALWYDASAGEPTVMASSRGPGDTGWSTPAQVSSPTAAASDLHADAGPDGGVTAVWLSTPSGAAASVQTATSSGGGESWSVPQTLSGPGETVSSPDLDIGQDGTAAVVWQRSPGDGADLLIPLRVRPPGETTWSDSDPAPTTTTVAFAPQVAVDGHGQPTVAWHNSGGQGERIRAKHFANGQWYGTKTIAPPTTDGLPPGTPGRFDLAASRWVTRLAWEWVTVDHTEVWEARRLTAGLAWSAATQLSEPGEDAHDPVIAADGDFTSAVVWRRDDVGTHTARASWTATAGDRHLTTLGPADATAVPRVSVSGASSAATWVAPSEGGAAPLLESSLTAGAWSAPEPVVTTGVADPAAHGVAVDMFGNVATAWVGSDGANDLVAARVLVAEGPMPLLAAPPHLAPGTKAQVTLTWSVLDWDGPAVTGQKLRVRQVGDSAHPWQDAGAPAPPATALRYVGKPGRSYCFQLRATSQDGAVGRWSPERCTTMPLDDRAATNRGWKRSGDGQDYRGTISRGARKGLKLAFLDAQFDELWILARTAPGAGSVDVYVGNVRMGRWSLAAPSARRVAIPIVDSRPTVDRGAPAKDVRLITTSDKPVSIDGIYLVNHVPVHWQGAE